MKIITTLPPPSISKHVSSIFIMEDRNQRNDFILPLFANGSPTLIFNSAKAISNHKNIAHLTLYGQTVKPNALSIKTDFTLIAYFFYPHAINSLFGMAASDLTDESLEMNLLGSAQKHRLQERLLNMPILHDRLTLLNNFIQQLTDKAIKVNDQTACATKKIKHSQGLYPLQNIHKELGITERTLQRLFETHIGIAPKTYCRICQFNAAFRQLNQHQFIKYSDVAYDNGFADQSHFIRVFKAFTNLTPGGYLQKTKALSFEV